jgi:simple sugar transport system ATP-binding protein
MSTAVTNSKRLDGPAPDGGGVILRMRGVSKVYKGVHAVRDIDFDVRAGEVHALVGENGAGKSTLCKMIAGAITPDAGEMWVGGEPVTFRHPSDAIARGIAMVYQETSLVPSMTVAQNLDLGDEPLVTRNRTMNIAAQQLLQSMSFGVDPAAYVSTLGSAKRQMVEIARAVRMNARIVIFDEPTASLTPEDIMHLFLTIDRLKAAGLGIIFVSHALEEALEISDRVTVLRDGEHQITRPAAGLTRDELVQHIVGRTVDSYYVNRAGGGEPRPAREKVLTVENLTMGGIVKNMTFSAYAGEVLGIFGLVGSGRTETAKVIAGVLKRNRIHGGHVRLRGKEVRYRVPTQAIRDGIAYITEDRKVNGFFETMGIAENVYLGRLASPKYRRLLIKRKELRSVVQRFIDQLRIRTINTDAKVVELSGGNQQKVTIAKSLAQDPDVLIFDEPTRGVDVGAIPEIHRIIRELAADGKAVIVISSYLPEIMAISDRLLVARQGRIAAEFSPERATAEQIMYAAIF